MPSASDASAFDRDASDTPTYVDTPYGLITASGTRFHVRKADVEAFADAVLDYVSLEQLVQWAERWRRVPDAAAAWALPALLWTQPPLTAALVTLAGYAVLHLVGPSVVSTWGARALRWLDHAVVQGLVYVGVLSALAAAEQYVALGVGLAGFVLVRWGLLAWASRPLLRPAWRVLYTLPVPDQILRALIVRVAVNHHLPMPELDRMRRDIAENMPSDPA
jgi:hypothetical protein